MMSKLEFWESFVFLKQKCISFANRPFLPPFYISSARKLVLWASRKVESSRHLVNTILYEGCMIPGFQILFAFPRQEQARVFSHSRLLSTREQESVS